MGHPRKEIVMDMITRLLFQADSYLKQFNATVIAAYVEPHAVILDRTAFYPDGTLKRTDGF
jgi:Ser-tRNA(Ala) deacylase AlaX